MSGWQVVLQKTVALFLVMLVGAWAARIGFWSPEAGRTLSRLLVDLVYPCYVVVQFLRTVDGDILRLNWYVPLLGFAVIAVGQAAGWLGGVAVRHPVRRRTFIFLVAITNWIYLPLPIAEALFGDSGVRTVLLMNVGCQAAIWTLGVATLSPGLSPKDSLRHVATNPGMVATVGGLLLAVWVPALRGGAPDYPVLYTVLEAAEMLGGLTIPLSLLIIGAQLGSCPLADLKPEPALWGVLALRLAAAPLLAILLVQAAARVGLVIPDAPRQIFYLVAAMPIAISCTLFTERYGGDSLLSAKAILASTLASLATVPLLFRLIQSQGW